ncbi:hypothetical protein G7Z17_g1348 [Cylindrodendrum hubeiense]|uniref:Major facilitator superfamily (MFS) profile domain-containing protein n=1 Tax=Cylindrodendrum hubeiense TaxID=595255 RepID=A0A9P5LFF6_9HYPO|nr:hypothetical protein G7Z17_g1348 [Cylindrodendrum hubeiense]
MSVSKAVALPDVANDSLNHEVKTTSRWRRIAGLFWDSFEGDPRDRKYVRKLDSFMFTTICLGYFIKYLDQTNISNAFVSGMREDLELYGNERNWLNIWFSLGVMVGSLPTMMFQLSWARPSYFIPACEIVWSALVMSMAAAKNIETLYALRFFIGLFEACAFPGYIALLGGWYGPKELTKRVAILLEIESIANLPHTTKAFYLSAEDRAYGIQRIEKVGQRPPVKLSYKVIKEVYSGWKIWAFVFPYVMLAACHTATSYFNLWLSAAGYSVVKVNVLPTGGNAVAIVVTIFWGILADRTGKRLILINSLVLLMILSNILLSVWNIPKAGLMFAYYLSYAGSATTPVLIAWGAELNASNPNLRQLLVATSNIVSYAWVLWVPLVLFPTYDAPKYKYGYQILVLFGGLAIVGTFLLSYLHKRDV